MAEYEPDDSRVVTQTQNRAPGEPPRTGPREDQARAEAGQQTTEQRQAAAGGERAIEGDAEGHPDRMGAFAGEAQAEGAESENVPDEPAQGTQGGSWRDSSE